MVIAGGRTAIDDFVELTKPRLTTLAVITAVASFYLGSRGAVNVVALFNTLLGVALMGAGGSALNHLLERETDCYMGRTRNRPLPSGRMEAREALLFGATLSVAGTVYLTVLINPLTGLLSVVALVSYLFVYTPLKRKTAFCTVVGAVPGALPCLMGWTAARNEIGPVGLVLFAILFLWQFPHFLAIAWMFRDDYARAGMKVLCVVEPDGGSTSRQVVIWSMTLLPVSMAPTLLGVTGPAYFFISFALGLAFLAAAVNMAVRRSHTTARALLLASVIYLPLQQAAMLLCKVH